MGQVTTNLNVYSSKAFMKVLLKLNLSQILPMLDQSMTINILSLQTVCYTTADLNQSLLEHLL